MTDVAIHARIFEADPTDDFVVKRTAAVKKIAGRFGKSRATADILQAASELALSVEVGGAMPPALENDVEAALKEQSPSFVREGQSIQMLACALMAASQYLNSPPGNSALSIVDVFAVGIWSAFGFQLPREEAKLEALRKEVADRARSIVLATATRARTRAPVPDPVVTHAEGADLAAMAGEVTAKLKPTVEALRSNAALDREEIDLLWWALGDWSEALNARISTSGPLAAACGAGIDAGRLLRCLPGDAHRHLVLRNVKPGSPCNLQQLVEQLGDGRARLATLYQSDTTVARSPLVFPFLTGIVRGEADSAAAQKQRPVEEWAERALLESAILRVTSLS